MFKDNLQAYWHLLRGVVTVTRVMAFEKFTALFLFFYLLSAFSLSLLASVIHWGAGIAVLVIIMMLFTKVLNNVQFLKRMLIRKGDRIEYADPNETDGKEMFKKAEIVLKMRPAEVEKTRLISTELMEGNQHFYLIRLGEEVSVIAFDWIIGLSPEFLEIGFAHE